jgi:cell division protein ZapA
LNKQIVSSQQVDVQIMGQSYTLACSEDGEADLLAAVRKVDAAMCGIRDTGRIKARDRIAVLACILLAHELIQRDAAPSVPRQDAPAAPVVDREQEQRLAALVARLDQALAGDDKLV